MDEMHRFERNFEKLFEKIEELVIGHQEIKAQITHLVSERQHSEEKINKAHKALFGEDDHEKGLTYRVPKLEEAERHRKWLSAAVIVAVITATVKAVVDWVSG